MTMETVCRNRRGRYARLPQTAERDVLAVRLRSEGQSYHQIAEALGYANRSAAFKAVDRALQAIVEPDVHKLREMELARLDTMHARLWATMLRPDDRPVAETVLLLLQVMDRRAKLLGLYARPIKTKRRAQPARHRITVADGTPE